MRQFCRYCDNFFVNAGGNYCSEKRIKPTDRQAKVPNTCRFFEYNPDDAFASYAKRKKEEELRRKIAKRK